MSWTFKSNVWLKRETTVTQSWLNIFTSVEKGDVFHSMEAPKSIQCVMKQSLEVGFLASTIVTWDFETIFCKASLRRELICHSKLVFGVSRIDFGASMMSYKWPLTRIIRGCFISDLPVGNWILALSCVSWAIFELALNRSRIPSLNIQTHFKSSKTFNTNFRTDKCTNKPD